MPPDLPLAVCCLVLTTSKGVVTQAARDAATPAAYHHRSDNYSSISPAYGHTDGHRSSR